MSTVPLILDEVDVESGISKGGVSSIINDIAYKNNVAQANVYIRMGFLRKVYSLLTLQILVSTVTGAVCVFNPVVRFFVHNNDWLLSVAFLLTVITLIALHIKRRETPTNFILLAVFTVVQAYSVAVVTTFYDQLVVLQAFLLTGAVVGGLTVFTLQTKKDFSFLSVGLFAGLWILILGGFLQLIIGNSTLDLCFSIGGALIFSLFIIYDTQMLMQKLSPEEYILATINLYLDIVNLFLYILRILEALKRQ